MQPQAAAALATTLAAVRSPMRKLEAIAAMTRTLANEVGTHGYSRVLTGVLTEVLTTVLTTVLTGTLAVPH